MSCTLRYDVGHSTVQAILQVDFLAFLGLNLHDVSRWAGAGLPRRECQCFSISLPLQINLCMQLRQTCIKICQDKNNPAAIRRCCQTIANNLTEALGLSHAIVEQESCFLDSIFENPGDLVHWMAYADWLSEQGDPVRSKRSELICGWLGSKSIKVHNGGIPAIAHEIRRLLHRRGS